jgi:hypothetical protein
LVSNKVYGTVELPFDLLPEVWTSDILADDMNLLDVPLPDKTRGSKPMESLETLATSLKLEESDFKIPEFKVESRDARIRRQLDLLSRLSKE